jgi:outer membrane protein assembly factor BamB
MVYYTSPDGYIVALDARTGEVRWETKSSGGMVAGVIVVEGKVISGPLVLADARQLLRGGPRRQTGAELWRFYTAAGLERARR